MREKLSVVIPVYNAENYIERALESVLGQTYPVYEAVCVDDGSTDGSLQVLRAYAQRDRRVKVIHKDNGGSTSARKAGVQETQGDYLTFVDADDFIEPDMYAELMALAVRYKADLVTSGLIRDYGDSMTLEREALEPGVYEGERLSTGILAKLVDRQRFYKARLSPHIVNMIFRADILREVQMNVDDRVIVGDDDAVIYPFLFRSRTVVISGKNFYHYCIRESGSIMGVRRANDYRAIQALFEHLEREFRRADQPGLELMKQFEILKTYFLLLRFPSKVLKYERGMLYPFGKIKKEDRILLYGAGKFGAVLKEYLDGQSLKVIGWIDKSANRPGVLRPDEIQSLHFDRVIIAVLVADAVEEIRGDLNTMGIPNENVLCVNV